MRGKLKCMCPSWVGWVWTQNVPPPLVAAPLHLPVARHPPTFRAGRPQGPGQSSFQKNEHGDDESASMTK
eukprot:364585-Chlamydomonas_euryale.AAC.22